MKLRQQRLDHEAALEKKGEEDPKDEEGRYNDRKDCMFCGKLIKEIGGLITEGVSIQPLQKKPPRALLDHTTRPLSALTALMRRPTDAPLATLRGLSLASVTS